MGTDTVGVEVLDGLSLQVAVHFSRLWSNRRELVESSEQWITGDGELVDLRRRAQVDLLQGRVTNDLEV